MIIALISLFVKSFFEDLKKTTADKVCSCSWRGKRDLNPRAGFPTYSLSRGAPSPLGYFRMLNLKKYNANYQKNWRRGWDSNPRDR